MKTQAWLERLSEQLPGWHVWYWSAGGVVGSRGWYAVPAPDDITHRDAIYLPNRLGPYPTPQELRDDVRPRYGWYDVCETCGIPAQQCGHRQPEREKEL